jgi:hypothetical protein
MEVELFSGTYYIYKRMARKAKITAVPIDQEAEIAPQVDDDEVSLPEGSQTKGKNDAQHMTDIINEVNTPVLTHSVEDQIETPAAPSLAGMQPVVETKAKAKRASKAKPAVVVEPEVEVTASLDEVEAVITLPLPEELKVDTKVACPDCGKQMSAKTLKYSHGPNCSSKKQKTNTDQKEESQPNIVRNPLTEALLDHWKEQKCTRAARAVRRQEMVEKLMQNAF